MPVFGDSVQLDDHKVGHFGYTAAKIDDLEASQFTLATVVCDRSGSTAPFSKDMEEALKSTVEALKQSPQSDQILMRVVTFDNQIEELHGFVPVDSIGSDQYDGSLRPGGMTALFDACITAVEATESYSSKLAGKNYKNNAVVIVITDGLNNSGKFSRDVDVDYVKQCFSETIQREQLESLATILIAVNWSACKPQLETFHQDAGFTQPLIGVENATPDAIARVGQFVATSISSTSMSLGTGGPSQPVTF